MDSIERTRRWIIGMQSKNGGWGSFDADNNYNYLNIFISSFLGKFIIIGCSWSLLFYFLAEIRHIVWDLGYGYEIKTANISGIFIFILSLVLTFIIWVAI